MATPIQKYDYLGASVMQYMQYRDAETDRMLIAVPGGSYVIVPADSGAPDDEGNPTELPVPPSDGRWMPHPVPAASRPALAAPAAPTMPSGGGE